MPSTLPTSTSVATTTEDATGRLPVAPANATSTPELARAKLTLQSSLRHFPDFPIPGIDFVDILPLFSTSALQETLLSALEAEVLAGFGGKPDVIVALDARGFLFGPGLAVRLGCGFAPVRKRGKIPGPTVEVGFKKEYGEDFFQMQGDAVAKGQRVLVVDDIIATGMFLTFFCTFSSLPCPCFGRGAERLPAASRAETTCRGGFLYYDD
jgi:adenine phosphoribosyltransferase